MVLSLLAVALPSAADLMWSVGGETADRHGVIGVRAVGTESVVFGARFKVCERRMVNFYKSLTPLEL